VIKHKAYIYVLGVLVFCCVLRVFISRTFNLQDFDHHRHTGHRGCQRRKSKKHFAMLHLILILALCTIESFTLRTFTPYQTHLTSSLIPSPLIKTLETLDIEFQRRQTSSPSNWKLLSDSTTYTYSPKSSIPSSVVHFIGGAVLGKFPHIAYNEFLSRLSESIGATIIAPSYDLSTDHASLATASNDAFASAMKELELNSNLPVFSIGHSLGSKLHTINELSSTNKQSRFGLGLISFSNADINSSSDMLKQFVKNVRGPGEAGSVDAMLDNFLNMASSQGVASAIPDLNFTPSKLELEELLASSSTPFSSSNVRLFSFEDDDIDDSLSFLDCTGRRQKNRLEKVSTSSLTGNHLSPVFIDLDLNSVAAGVAPQVLEQFGGFIAKKRLAFGKEEDVDDLVECVVRFMLGREEKENLNCLPN